MRALYNQSLLPLLYRQAQKYNPQACPALEHPNNSPWHGAAISGESPKQRGEARRRGRLISSALGPRANLAGPWSCALLRGRAGGSLSGHGRERRSHL